MAVTVSGILRDSGGNPSPNDVIKFYTVQGFNGALPSATLEVVTSETGSYDFELSVGIHILSVQYDRILTRVGKVTVTSETPSPQTLDTLLALGEPLLPDEIIAVKQLVAEANAAAQSVSEDANKVAQDKDEVAQNTQTVNEKTQIVVDAQSNVIEKAQQVATNTETVNEKTQTVLDAQADVTEKANQVASDAQQVSSDKQIVLDAKSDVTDKAQQVSADADQVAQDKLAVANNTQTVANNTQTVSSNATQVSEDKDAVTQMLADTEAAAQEAASTIPQTVNASLNDLSGGMVVNRLDANGNQNVMVKIPMMTNKIFNDALGTSWTPESDPHPAFIRPDGTTMPWFEFGMYQASNDGSGNPVSAAYKDPYTYVDFDEVKAKCQAMGVGWGMTSNAQWAAITLWCLANGYQPLGNTYYGYSHERSYLAGIRQDGGINGDANGSARILTGSGPVEFRHNKIMQGISDMVGNTWEWVDGLKSVGGQIFVATRERQDEAEWEAQAAYLDDGLKLNSELTDITSANVTWSSLGKSETYIANQLLQQLMIEPITETGEALGRLYYNNDGERFPRRGGGWGSGSYAGLGALAIDYERSSRYSSSGFRPAYFE